MASFKVKRPASSSEAQSESKKPRQKFLSEEDLTSITPTLDVYAQMDPVPDETNIKALVTRMLHTVSMELRGIPSCVRHIDSDWTMTRVSALPEDAFNDLARRYIQARNGNWEELVYAPCLWKQIPQATVNKPLHPSQTKATVKSWNYKYVGSAPDVLWQHINYHCQPENKESKHYAHFATIVQSSGMGKSRAVDELAKAHLVIPLNLANDDAAGFPPPDGEIRDWLLGTSVKPLVNDRVLAFLEALFITTHKTVQRRYRLDAGLPGVASDFRADMNDGMQWGSHGAFRKESYRSVAKLAGEIMKEHYTAEEVIHITPTKEAKDKNESYDFRPSNACRTLMDFLQKADEDYQIKDGNVYVKETNTPLVIIAFDEAHMLTERRNEVEEPWSAFGELRIALRSLIYFSVFALFLSTTGKISEFLSPKDRELSTRVLDGNLKLIQPFTDLAFDVYAIVLDGTQGFSLDLVTGDEYISRLGRPLFGSRWIAGDSSVRADAVHFARRKLLDVEQERADTLDQQLACLSQRLALEYNTTNYLARDAERRQVEGHMRVCLKIDENFESMISISGSEPLLAEAAYSALPPSEAPQAMKSVLEGFSVHKGDRGELLSMLLLTLARDAAVGPPTVQSGIPRSGKRYVSVSAFFGSLFTAFNARDRTRQKEDLFNTFKRDFEDSYVYFNHFIKVHQYAVLRAGYLLAILARGGGVLCANNQSGFDALVMMVHGLLATRSTLGFILWQVKNDPSYTRWDADLFAAMDPYKLQIWNKNDHPTKPIIRIVFALTAKKPSFSMVRTEVDANPEKGRSAYVAYDIWCAGISPEILAPIHPTLDHLWEALLQASAVYQNAYKSPMGSTDQEAIRRGLDVTTCADDRHYVHFDNLSLD